MAKGTKLAKYQQRIRTTVTDARRKQQHTIVALLLSFGIGFAKTQGVKLPTVVGIHPAALYGSLALMGAYFLKDKGSKRIAEAAADGMLSVAAYVAGSKGIPKVFGGYVGGEDDDFAEQEYY